MGAPVPVGHNPTTRDSIVPDHTITEADVALVVADPSNPSLTKGALLRLVRAKVKEYANLACSAVQNSKDKLTGETLLKLREPTW